MIDMQEAGSDCQHGMERARLILPQAPDSETGPVKAWLEPVEMLTYEPAPPDPNPLFLEKRVYQGSSGRVYPLPVIDRIQTAPVMRTWQAAHIENEFIRVMVLPEIGGRIHVGFDKRNGYDFFYRQNVIKPALVGLAGPWVSGGVEFNWPQHHRPATYMPVTVSIERSEDGSVTLWCSDHDPMERMKGMHGICLRPGKALLEVKVRLYNRTTDTRTFLWWANVATHVNERYQSFFPRDVRFAADHAKRAITTYPLSEGTYYGIDYGARAQNGIAEPQRPSRFVPDGSYPPNDLGWYANIPVPTSYMIANSAGDFSGGYDHKRDAGLVAVANHHIAPGKKQWTWGNHDFGYAWDACLTDSDGPYVELMVGAYTDNQPDFSFLAPGETKAFSQFWYPISQIGVPDIANADAALRIERSESSIAIHLQVTSSFANSTIRLSADGKLIGLWRGDLSVDAPHHEAFEAAEAQENLVITIEAEGRTILRYAPSELSPADPPEVAEEPAAPANMASVDELFLTGLHLEQYRHPTRSPESYWLEALRRDPGDSRCNHAMGRWHLRRGELLLAEDYLQTAIRRMRRRNPNPYDGEPLYHLGLTLQYRGETSKAYDAFYKATWNAAWAGPAYHRLAEIACQSQDWTTALDHIERALIKDADNLNARNLKTIVLTRLGRLDEASRLMEETRALDPLDITSRYLHSGALPADGQQTLDLCFDFIRAGLITESRQILAAPAPQTSVDGSPTLLLYLAAYVARKLNLPSEAQALAEKAAGADTQYVFPHRIEELLLLEDALRANENDAHAHFFLGNLLYDKRRHHEAIAHWERVTQLDPGLATAWRNLAFGYFNIRHHAGAALNAFRHAREQAPNDGRILYEYDQLLKRTGVSPIERLSLLQQHPSLIATRDDLSVEVASLLNSESRPAESLALLTSRQFQPWEGGEGAALTQYMRAHLLMAIASLRAQRPLPAIRHLQSAQHPPASLAEAKHVLLNTSVLAYWLGVAFEQAGDPTKARAQFELSAATRIDFQQMHVQDISENTYWSGLALKRLGRTGEANALFDQIVAHADHLAQQPSVIDFFATSLPAMLLFDEDLTVRQQITATFLRAQALIGLDREEGFTLLQHLLQQDRNHTGVIDLLHIAERETCTRPS